jgi:hypothetical protein
MSLGRVPVIISDDWVEIPSVDWNAISIRISEKDIGSIETILLDHEKDWEEMGRLAQKQWKKHFTDTSKHQYLFDQLLSLHRIHKEKPYTLTRYKQLWRSRTFLHNNEWTIYQRLASKLRLF